MDLAIAGPGGDWFVAIGPIELFFPRAAYSLLGDWVWIVLIALYFFVLMLIALNTSPKLVVYGLDHGKLRLQVCELLENEKSERSGLATWSNYPNWVFVRALNQRDEAAFLKSNRLANNRI